MAMMLAGLSLAEKARQAEARAAVDLSMSPSQTQHGSTGGGQLLRIDEEVPTTTETTPNPVDPVGTAPGPEVCSSFLALI
jgi:hypothetical protein